MMSSPGVCAPSHTKQPVKAGGRESMCRYFRPADAGSRYPVGGVCKGLPGVLPMIPTVEEYRTWCSTPNHAACPIYRSCEGQGDVEAWLRRQEEEWGLRTRGARGGMSPPPVRQCRSWKGVSADRLAAEGSG
jgi:hypothetical protein